MHTHACSVNRNLLFAGKGSGSLIGGYLMKAFGTRPTYRIFAVMTLITGIMYYIFNVAYLKKQPQTEGNDIVKKKPKTVDKQNGLESGTIEIGLEEKGKNGAEKGNETNERSGIDNQVFNQDREIIEGTAEENNKRESMEAAKNAKNLDQIEKVPSEECRKRLGATRLKKVEADECERDKGCTVKNGTANLSFESDRNRCDVTVERQTEEKK